MKILFLQDDFPPKSFGGAGIVAFNSAAALRQKGHSVFVITSVQKRDEEGGEERDGLKIFKIYSDYHKRWRAYLSLYNPRTAKKVKKIIGRIKPDIIHVHYIHYYLSYHVLKIAKKSGAKVFLTAHDTMLVSYGKLSFPCGTKNFKVNAARNIRTAGKNYNPFRNFFIKRYLKYVDKIFSISDILRDFLAQNGIKNAAVLYNGVDVAGWGCLPQKIEDFKRGLNIQNKKVILFGGRLSGAKGGEQILKSLAGIPAGKDDIILLVAGKKGDYSEKMEALAKELGVENKVMFTGWLDREDMKAAFFSCDVCVTPSIYFDPFNLFNIEAMAAKKPVVGTCFGGTPEIVLDGETGYIVNPLDHKLMAEKIGDLLNNPEKARQFGEAGYKRVQEKFNLITQTERLLNWYKSF